jgi:phage replication initiation protein
VKELILMGKKKISPLDKTLVEQRILEIQNDEEY